MKFWYCDKMILSMKSNDMDTATLKRKNFMAN